MILSKSIVVLNIKHKRAQHLLAGNPQSGKPFLILTKTFIIIFIEVKRKMYTLVVVDMQASFDASNHIAVRKNVAREIKDAMKLNAGILFLEFTRNGPTQPDLFDLTMGYKRAHVALKGANDGSKECMTYLTHYNLPQQHFKVVGVNTSYCVRETVTGLTKLYPNAIIDVVADACNCSGSHSGALDAMSKMPQIVIRDDNQTLWSPL